MSQIGEKYLPIGSVVLLKGGNNRLMITGFCSMPANDRTKMYDYTGCLYPIGVMDSSRIALFNHEQIVEVSHLGYQNDDSKKFDGFLKKLMAEKNLRDSLKGIEKTNEESSSVISATSIISEETKNLEKQLQSVLKNINQEKDNNVEVFNYGLNQQETKEATKFGLNDDLKMNINSTFNQSNINWFN